MVKTSFVVVGALFATLVGASTRQQVPATSTVSGQVTMLERPGETTEDLGNVVVFLEPAASVATRARLAQTDSRVTLEKRQFSPRVTVVTQGSKVEFTNRDPWNHNVFSKMNGFFDTGVYGRDKTRDNVFAAPGVYPLYCNIHPRMTGFVITLTTPYFAQAGADGRFAIANVPAGQYKMHVWHDRATEVVRDVMVPMTAAAKKPIELDARGYKYVQHKNKFGQDYTSAAGDRY